MEYAKKCNADLLLATDPDCDRVGIAVKNKAGEYELLTGNQTGMLLLDYICSQRVKHDKMPADPVMVKTIVTMDMGEQIATHYGLRTINVLTGFKFIGEQIGNDFCAEAAKAVRFDDPDIKWQTVPWPKAEYILSEKDQRAERLGSEPKDFKGRAESPLVHAKPNKSNSCDQ